MSAQPWRPMVRYSKLLSPLMVGQRAVVVLSEPHHTLPQRELDANGQIVTTSLVQEVEEGNTGRFWTLNTLYVPDERQQGDGLDSWGPSA